MELPPWLEGKEVSVPDWESIVHFLIQNHCIAHRLNLAYKDGDKSLLEINELDSILFAVYKFFRHSSKKLAEAERFASIRKSKSYRLLKMYDVRWLSKFNVYTNILKNLPHLLETLQSISVKQGDFSAADRALAKNLLDRLTKPTTVYNLYGLTDVISIWATLIKRFQAEDYALTALLDDIRAFIMLLTEEILANDPRTPRLLELEALIKDEASFIHAFNIHFTEETMEDCLVFIKEFSFSLIENIEERFQDEPLIRALTILDLHLLLQLTINDVSSYGNFEILQLCKHFSERRQYKTKRKTYDYAFP